RDARHRVAAALEAERRLRDLPALPEPADEIAFLGAGVRHEDLVELRVAGDLLERPHLDAGLTHVEEQARDAFVLRHAGIGAREQDAPVRDVPAAGPDLLAVDDEVVALVLGTSAQARQVRAGVRLRVELAPHLLGREDLLEVALLLLRRAVHDDRRPDEADAEAMDGRRRVRARHLVCGDRLLHRRRSAAAVLLGPAHADVAGLVHRAMPRAPLLERRELGARDVRGKPCASLIAERTILGRECQIHRKPPWSLRTTMIEERVRHSRTRSERWGSSGAISGPPTSLNWTFLAR